MKIFYSKKETRNLGNYENVTIETGIENEIPKDSDYDFCFEKIKSFVNDKVEEEIESYFLTIDKIKTKVVNLINLNEDNRAVIKSFLKSFQVEKLQELTDDQLKEFNKKLKNI